MNFDFFDKEFFAEKEKAPDKHPALTKMRVLRNSFKSNVEIEVYLKALKEKNKEKIKTIEQKILAKLDWAELLPSIIGALMSRYEIEAVNNILGMTCVKNEIRKNNNLDYDLALVFLDSASIDGWVEHCNQKTAFLKTNRMEFLKVFLYSPKILTLSAKEMSIIIQKMLATQTMKDLDLSSGKNGLLEVVVATSSKVLVEVFFTEFAKRHGAKKLLAFIKSAGYSKDERTEWVTSIAQSVSLTGVSYTKVVNKEGAKRYKI